MRHDDRISELTFLFVKPVGEIEMMTDGVWSAAENNELISEYSEWERELILKAREIQNSDHFVELPEINSYEIMERFCHEYPDRQISGRLSAVIKGKGAFRRFEDMIFDLGLQDEWKRFEHQAFQDIAIEWLEAEGIPFTRGDEIELSVEM